jgi:hypothetical protein
LRSTSVSDASTSRPHSSESSAANIANASSLSASEKNEDASPSKRARHEITVDDQPIKKTESNLDTFKMSPFLPYALPPSSSATYDQSMAALRASMAASSYLMAYNNRLKAAGSAASSECRDPFCTSCLTGSSAANGVHNGSSTMIRPYVCNWIQSDPNSVPSYCGKYFASSEELLIHLRTHTSTQVAEVVPDLSAYGRHPFLTPASRFHPYALKPPTAPAPHLLSNFLPPAPPPVPYLSSFSSFYPHLQSAALSNLFSHHRL